MEEIIFSSAFLVGTISSSLLGYYWLKTRQITPVYLKNMVKDLNYALEEQKRQTRSWKGKFIANNQTPRIEFEGDLSDTDQVANLIKEVLPEIKKAVPKDFKTYFDNPKLVDLGIELFKKNPKMGEQLLSRFVKKSSKKTESTPEQIPEFDSSQAI